MGPGAESPGTGDRGLRTRPLHPTMRTPRGDGAQPQRGSGRVPRGPETPVARARRFRARAQTTFSMNSERDTSLEPGRGQVATGVAPVGGPRERASLDGHV